MALLLLMLLQKGAHLAVPLSLDCRPTQIFPQFLGGHFLLIRLGLPTRLSLFARLTLLSRPALLARLSLLTGLPVLIQQAFLTGTRLRGTLLSGLIERGLLLLLLLGLLLFVLLRALFFLGLLGKRWRSRNCSRYCRADKQFPEHDILPFVMSNEFVSRRWTISAY